MPLADHGRSTFMRGGIRSPHGSGFTGQLYCQSVACGAAGLGAVHLRQLGQTDGRTERGIA